MNDVQLAQKMLEMLKSQREFFEKQMGFYEFVVRAFLEKANSQAIPNSENHVDESSTQNVEESIEDDSYSYDGEEMELHYNTKNEYCETKNEYCETKNEYCETKNEFEMYYDRDEEADDEESRMYPTTEYERMQKFLD